MCVPICSIFHVFPRFSYNMELLSFTVIKWLYGRYTHPQRYARNCAEEYLIRDNSLLPGAPLPHDECRTIQNWIFLDVSRLLKIETSTPKNHGICLNPAVRCDILRIEKGTTAHKVVDLITRINIELPPHHSAKVSGWFFYALYHQ